MGERYWVREKRNNKKNRAALELAIVQKSSEKNSLPEDNPSSPAAGEQGEEIRRKTVIWP